MPNYDSIIDKLLGKSEAGTMPWKPTYEDDRFIAALDGEVTFEIGRLEDGGFEFFMKDTDGKKIVEVTAHNRGPGHRDGEEGDRYFETMKRLFEAARITGLEVYKKLTSAEALLDRF